MKNKIDYCLVQWLNRELLPKNYAFKYNKGESRFSGIFNDIKKNKKIDSNNSKNNHAKLKNLEINIKKILSLEEKRTTLIIKNIPNKFTKENFLYLFNKEFEGKFDLFLLPTDVNEKKNYGYSFINFIKTLDIIYFYYCFNGKRWPNTNSIKICEIEFSKIQGTHKMLKHFPIKVVFILNKEENKKNMEDENNLNPTLNSCIKSISSEGNGMNIIHMNINNNININMNNINNLNFNNNNNFINFNNNNNYYYNFCNNSNFVKNNLKNNGVIFFQKLFNNFYNYNLNDIIMNNNNLNNSNLNNSNSINNIFINNNNNFINNNNDNINKILNINNNEIINDKKKIIIPFCFIKEFKEIYPNGIYIIKNNNLLVDEKVFGL